MRVAALALVILGAAFWTSIVAAHKLALFAAGDGPDIVGYAYFVPGDRAQDVAVTATLPDGAVAFQGRTDATGAFRFTPAVRTDYRLLASGADGHTAAFTVRAAELPPSLPPAAAPPVAAAPAPPPALAASSAPALGAEDIAAVVERGLSRQLLPLREQIDALEAKLRLQDALGGIGYIVGLGGLAYGLATWAAQRRK